MRLPPFQTLLDAYRVDVHRFLIASVGPVDADDCFQETWIAALRAYPQLKRNDNLRAWLLRIAERKAIDSHRARARRPQPSESLPEPGESAGAGSGESATEGADAALWAALRKLPSKQRTAVFCRSVLGLPYAELAELLECSQDAARRNVHEGLKVLREEWSR